MKSIRVILTVLMLAALAAGILIFMKKVDTEQKPLIDSEGFIGKSEIIIKDGQDGFAIMQKSSYEKEEGWGFLFA